MKIHPDPLMASYSAELKANRQEYVQACKLSSQLQKESGPEHLNPENTGIPPDGSTQDE